MMIKTAELKDRALDWAAGKASGLEIHISVSKKYGPAIFSETHGDFYSPSIDWAQGGPIIEREKIDVAFTEDGWYANMYDRMTDNTEGYVGNTFRCGGDGPTPLIAAMRCYVMSKLGDEVEVPDELI